MSETINELAAGFWPCGGLSRSDRTPASLTRSQDKPLGAGAGGVSGPIESEPPVPSQPLKVDSTQGVCHFPVMNGHALLFPELNRTDVEEKRLGLLERWRMFGKLADEFGGLAPQAFVDDLLGVSRQRVGDLIREGHLEQVEFIGTKWVSGRSLRAWMNDPKTHGGGRANKRPPMWKQVVFDAKTSLAELGAIIPDHWVGE